jgi:hypothetical protein
MFCSECEEEIPRGSVDHVVCNDDTVVCAGCAEDMTSDDLERN